MSTENKIDGINRFFLWVFGGIAALLIFSAILSAVKESSTNDALIKLSEKNNPVVAQCAMDPPGPYETTYLELCKWALTLDKDGTPK